MRAGGGSQNETDQTANFFWMLVIACGAILLIWWLGRPYVVGPIFWVRNLEIDLIRQVATAWSAFVQILGFSGPDIGTLSKVQTYITHVDSHKITFDEFAMVNRYVGDWVRLPIALILIGLAVYMFFHAGGAGLTRTFDMDKLLKTEVQNWPQITPITELDLLNQDLDDGAWAMSKQPLQFCQAHHLVDPGQVKEYKVWKLRRAPAQRIFTMQLGPLWAGADALPTYIKALYVIFSARALRQADVADRLIQQISRSAKASGQLDFSGVQTALKDYRDTKIIRWLESRHAYLYTLLATMLDLARAEGVLATAEILWLKPVDRRLWYMLNSVGRQTPFVEVAGPYAHWLAERKVGRPLRTPMVTEAVNALELCMLETLYVPKESSWRNTKED